MKSFIETNFILLEWIHFGSLNAFTLYKYLEQALYRYPKLAQQLSSLSFWRQSNKNEEINLHFYLLFYHITNATYIRGDVSLYISQGVFP